MECRDENDNYSWFYKSRPLYDKNEKRYLKVNDEIKIGISSDGKYLMHDGIIQELKLYKRTQEINEKNRYLNLLYRFGDQIDYAIHRQYILINFKFLDIYNGKPEFMYIEMDGSQFRKID